MLANHQNDSAFSPDGILKQAHSNVVVPSAGLVDLEIEDLEELKYFQLLKRTELEDYLKRNRLDVKQWIRYADYEIAQNDMRRARSVFERALRVESTNVPLWIHYIDAELKNQTVNHARNLLERATKLLPNVNKFWFKYLYVEESLGQLDLVRNIFEKWLMWDSYNEVCFDSFIEFELRYENYEKTRVLFARYAKISSKSSTWLKWINFEKQLCEIDQIRQVFDTAIDNLDFNKDYVELGLVLQEYAVWEAQQNETERSTALISICQAKSNISSGFVNKFVKLYMDNYDFMKTKIEEYKKLTVIDPKDHLSWWGLLESMQAVASEQELCGTFETCLVESRPEISTFKNDEWTNYIWIWIKYLIFLENSRSLNIECASKYKELIDDVLLPMQSFTFSEIWLLYAKYLIRTASSSIFEDTRWKDVLNLSIEQYPKSSTFKNYILVLIGVKDFDAARNIYDKYLQYDPLSFEAWNGYLKLENDLGDEERCRGLYSACIKVIPESQKKTVYYNYIDFETEQGEYENARVLWHSLCHQVYSNEPLLWVKWSNWELSAPTEEQLEKMNNEEDNDELDFELNEQNKSNAREIFEQAIKFFKASSSKRVEIFEAYQRFEETYGSPESVERINKRMPIVHRSIVKEGGIDREKIEYVFPDDELSTASAGLSKLLGMAKKWENSEL